MTPAQTQSHAETQSKDVIQSTKSYRLINTTGHGFNAATTDVIFDERRSKVA